MNTKRNAMSVDLFGTTVTVTFANGKDLAIDTATLSPEIQRMAMMHGIKQKLVDAGAIARNTETGASASIDDKYSAVHEVYERLTSPDGTWNKERGNGGEKSTSGAGNLLVRAIMQMTGKNKDYVDQFLSAKTKKEREALKNNTRVAAIIAELKAAKVGDVDTDELLGELGIEPVEQIVSVDTGTPMVTPQLAMLAPKRKRKPKAEAVA